MRPKPTLIAFDLDGTLVDSAPDLAYSADTMLAEFGYPAAGLETVRSWIGNGIPMLVKRALTGELWPQTEPAEFAEALPVFMDLYQAHVCERSRLFPGVIEGLAALKAQGYKTACITNKHSRFTLPLLEQLEVTAYLDQIGCGDHFEKQKPDPEPLLRTAERFGTAPVDCLMIGDTDNDVKAARAAGFGILCVPYGYRRCERAEDLGADGVIPSLADLPAYFDC